MGSALKRYRALMGFMAVASVAAIVASSSVAATSSGRSGLRPESVSRTAVSALAASALPTSEAALRKAVAGQTVQMAIVGQPNSIMTNLWQTIRILQRDYGVTAQLTYMNSEPMTAALISNAIDVGVVSFASVAAAANAGANLQVVAGEYQRNVDVAVAPASASSLKDLQGKPFGVSQSLTSVIGITAQQCFQQAGMDLRRDTHTISLNNTSAVQQGITSGQLAGGLVTLDRFNDMNAESPNKYRILCKGWGASPQLTDVFVVNRNWIGSHGPLTLAIAVAEQKAAAWAKSNKAQWEALAMANSSGLTKAAAGEDYDAFVGRLNEWPIGGGLNKKLCNDTLNISYVFKAIDQRYTCGDLVTFAYQNAAAKLLAPKTSKVTKKKVSHAKKHKKTTR